MRKPTLTLLPRNDQVDKTKQSEWMLFLASRPCLCIYGHDSSRCTRPHEAHFVLDKGISNRS